MSQQTIKQQARRTAREMAERRRREREERERRVIDLAEQVMIAVGERDAAVAEAEKRAGEALRELTEREGLSLGEAVEWCAETITVREATRLRRLAVPVEDLGEVPGVPDFGPAAAKAITGAEKAEAAAADGSGGAGGGSSAG